MTLQETFLQCFEGDPAQSWSRLGKYDLLDVFEANVELDKFKDFEFPLMFILPVIDDMKQETSGLWVSDARLQGFIMFRAEQHVNDQNKLALEPQMLDLKLKVKKFVNRLQTTDVVDKTKPITRVICTPFYGDFDGHCHGHSIQIFGNWVETKSNCTT
jgi:hypothetical protein